MNDYERYMAYFDAKIKAAEEDRRRHRERMDELMRLGELLSDNATVENVGTMRSMANSIYDPARRDTFKRPAWLQKEIENFATYVGSLPE